MSSRILNNTKADYLANNIEIIIIMNEESNRIRHNYFLGSKLFSLFYRQATHIANTQTTENMRGKFKLFFYETNLRHLQRSIDRIHNITVTYKDLTRIQCDVGITN